MTRLATALAAGVLALAGCGGDDDDGDTETAAAPAEPPHWTYSGEDGPEHWGAIDAAYETCASGREQSPIDVPDFFDGVNRERFDFRYEDAVATLENNGHTVQASYEPGNELIAGDERYRLLQFHFHAPGEHKLFGKRFPLEFHFVHANADGELLVVGVLVTPGDPSSDWDKVAGALPGADGETAELAAFNARELLPADAETSGRYYTYDGSLTVPPCSEGVSWHLYTEPIEFSPQQIREFTDVFDDNSRPVQDLGGRSVRIVRPAG